MTALASNSRRVTRAFAVRTAVRVVAIADKTVTATLRADVYVQVSFFIVAHDNSSSVFLWKELYQQRASRKRLRKYLDRFSLFTGCRLEHPE
jgi:hypothetical protein